MSWNISYIGTPKKIIEALETKSTELNGPSKEEYDIALPHLKGLVEMNYSEAHPQMCIRINASGHAYKAKGNNYSNCNVSIASIDGELV